MVSLPVAKDKTRGESHGCGTTCGTSCGAGLEKHYPTTAVRYGAMNSIGEFSYKPGTVFKCGAKVVIESDRGVELGQQVSLSCNGCSKQVTREQIQRYVQTSGPEFFKLSAGRILREANDQDILEQQQLNSHLCDDIETCALLAAQLELEIKVVTCEHLLGGERIVFYFIADNRIDFRQLVKELAHHYRTRIEMRQVGPRDEARLVADHEICGRECCCRTFLKHPRPVTMKMAKVQKSTLDPSKVSGRCGRLRCCLRYEHEGYEELDAKLPKLNAVVDTAAGPALVVDRQILTQLLMVRSQDGKQFAVAVEEVKGLLPANAYTPPAPPEERRDSRTSEPADGGQRRGGPPRGPQDRGGDRREAQRGPYPARPTRGPQGPRREDASPEAPVERAARPREEPAPPADPAAVPPKSPPSGPVEGAPRADATGRVSDAAKRRRRRRRQRPGGANTNDSSAPPTPPASPDAN